MPEKSHRPPRPYTDIPELSPAKPRCAACGRALYGNVVKSPICPWCDVVRQDAETARDKARTDTPTEASFRQGWRDMQRGNTRPVADLWEGIEATPIDGSAPDDEDVDFDTIARETWTKADDDTPEFTYEDSEDSEFNDFEGEGEA